MPTPGQRTARESVRAVLGGHPLLSPCSIVYTTPCSGSVGSSRLTDTFFPPPHWPTLQQLLCFARALLRRPRVLLLQTWREREEE